MSCPGFEGLTVSPDGNTLYALLQSATIQDGGNKKSDSRFTRLLAYDVSEPTAVTPSLTGEWVVPLPQDSSGDTLAQSEMHFISDDVFFVLARDANGHGGSSDTSAYKSVIKLFIVFGERTLLIPNITGKRTSSTYLEQQIFMAANSTILLTQ